MIPKQEKYLTKSYFSDKIWVISLARRGTLYNNEVIIEEYWYLFPVFWREKSLFGVFFLRQRKQIMSPCEAFREFSQCTMYQRHRAISELTLATALSEKYPADRLPSRPPSSRALMYELPMRNIVSNGPIPQHLPPLCFHTKEYTVCTSYASCACITPSWPYPWVWTALCPGWGRAGPSLCRPSSPQTPPGRHRRAATGKGTTGTPSGCTCRWTTLR